MTEASQPLDTIEQSAVEIDPKEEIIGEALRKYVEVAKSLETNFLQGLIIGAATDGSPESLQGKACIWNILASDHDDPESLGVHAKSIHDLSEASSDFLFAVLDIMDSRFAYVKPSKLDLLRKRIQETKLEVTEIYFD